MNSRERMLTVLANGRPDRLPCQMHGWMDYYLEHYLGGMDWYQAYEKFGMDYAIYVSPDYTYDQRDLAKWQIIRNDLGLSDNGDFQWEETIVTPKGRLHRVLARNDITVWETEVVIKSERDFEIWNEFYPVPVAADFSAIRKAKDRLGDKGIIRSHPFSHGQGSPWQSFCFLTGLEKAIYWAMDNPQFIHYALEELLKKILRATELWKGTPADMVETGGGAASNTVISPDMFKEFCLPYDKREHAMFHEIGVKIVYHLCGGIMQLLELVAQNGADGIETMTPAGMGGDCILKEASRRVGDKLFFIGGFDQNAGFEQGTPETVRKLVFECFEATMDNAGYIIAPSDHFFSGDPKNIQAFADACKECVY
jgi:uroporphyrinogen-III decarboxylase